MRHPLIIVEGPDGSGKSTLMQTLGYTPVKFRALRKGDGGTKADGTCGESSGWAGYVPAQEAYWNAVLGAEPGTAFDRFHLSEVVYGPLLRGASGIEMFDFLELNARLQSRRVPVILCLPSWKTTLRNIEAPGRERPAFQTEEFLRKAYDRFDLLARGVLSASPITNPVTLVYDYTRHDVPFSRGRYAS